MITTVVIGYVCGWILVTIGVYVVGLRLADECRPPPPRLGVSIVAGAVWPLLLIGVVEFSPVVLYRRIHSKPESGVVISA